MAGSIHPPALTDLISNPIHHAMNEYWAAQQQTPWQWFWSLGHADLTNVFNTWIVMIILIVAGYLVTRKLELVPGGHQNFWEVALTTVDDLVSQTMGEHGKDYFPLIAALALFILTCNLIGIIPYLFSSTSNLNTTLSLALVAFVMTHYVGIRVHGAHYYKHFLGPVPWLIPLILPIEIIGHLSRVLSLSFRLFGNIMGEDLAIAILTILVPFIVPLPMMFLHVFISFIQTLVFIMLTMMYIYGSLEEAH